MSSVAGKPSEYMQFSRVHFL